MKLRFKSVAAVAIVLEVAACVSSVPATRVIAPTPEVVAIDIVLPHARGFTVSERKKIDSIVTFLRQRCRWIASPGEKISEEAKDLGYQVVIRRIDGSREAIQVVKNEVEKASYHSVLSTRAKEALDDLCDVETVHLSPFDQKAGAAH